MAELPILPVKTDALLADTMHMTAEEFGVYCRLLFVMWRHGGRLKEDDSELASISGVTLKRWKAIKEKVMRPMTVAVGEVSQKRLTDTWINVQELRRKRATASNARWGSKDNPKPMQMDSNRNATKNQNQINLPSSFPTVAARGNAAEVPKHPETQRLLASLDYLKSRKNPVVVEQVSAAEGKKFWIDYGTTAWICHELDRKARELPAVHPFKVTIDSVEKTGAYFDQPFASGYDEQTGEKLSAAGEASAVA